MVASKLMVVSLVVLEESHSNQENRQSEGLREAEIVKYIRRTGTVIMTHIVPCQVVASLVFCQQAKEVK